MSIGWTMQAEPREAILELSRRLEDMYFDPHYITTCREHPLNRVFTQGDWYIIIEKIGNTFCFKGPKCWGPMRHAHRTYLNDRTQILWLPRFDQLWSLALKEGLETFQFTTQPDGIRCTINRMAYGYTPETSLYKWLALKYGN